MPQDTKRICNWNLHTDILKKMFTELHRKEFLLNPVVYLEKNRESIALNSDKDVCNGWKAGRIYFIDEIRCEFFIPSCTDPSEFAQGKLRDLVSIGTDFSLQAFQPSNNHSQRDWVLTEQTPQFSFFLLQFLFSPFSLRFVYNPGSPWKEGTLYYKH